jgi:hypothetical protein
VTDVLEGGPLGHREPELAGKREDKDALVVEGATLAVPKVEKARSVGALLHSEAAGILSGHLAD